MEYTVEIAVQTARPLTKAALFDVAELGGVSVGGVGDRRLETTLTIQAEDPPAAARAAIDQVTRRAPGEVICVEVMTVEEQDRRLAVAALELAGVAEIAHMLDVSKQRVTQLAERSDFPAPIARLASGPVWRRGDMSTFADGWHRRPGRPKKAVNSS